MTSDCGIVLAGAKYDCIPELVDLKLVCFSYGFMEYIARRVHPSVIVVELYSTLNKAGRSDIFSFRTKNLHLLRFRTKNLDQLHLLSFRGTFLTVPLHRER